MKIEIRLTEKEQDILDLLSTGKSNKEIASELNITVNTVRHYLRILSRMFQCSNRTELAIKNLQRVGKVI